MGSARRSPHPRHLLAGLASAGLVLVLHGGLLFNLPVFNLPAGPAGRSSPTAAPRSVQVRQIVSTWVAPTLSAPLRPPSAAAPAAVLPAHPRPAVPPRATPAAPALATAAPAPAEVGGASVADESAGGAQPAEAPVYATRLAPPATLHYRLRRSAGQGQAVLRWSPDGGRYTLTLVGQLPAAQQVAWASHGTLDAHGIAPERYTESRRGREVRAANFQRERARITFSGPQIEHALPPGAQDRLSWMLQLGAVLAAEPARATAGQQVLLFVVGGRGDAEVWTFAVLGHEHIELAGAEGSVETLLLRREPRRPYDTLVEVWLDPARHHLPVRAQLSVRGDGTRFELERLSLP